MLFFDSSRLVPDSVSMDPQYTVADCPSFDLEPDGEENEIMELVWHDGEVVAQNLKKGGSFRGGEQQVSLREDEWASWITFPVEDSASDRDFYDRLFDIADPPPTTQSTAIVEFPTIPPPQPEVVSQPTRVQNFAHFSRILTNPRSITEAVGSAVVESNETPLTRPGIADQSHTAAESQPCWNPESRGGGNVSKSSFNHQCSPQNSPPPPPPPASENRKRKIRDADDGAAHLSKESGDGGGQGSWSSTKTKKSRSAQVHNLSERRRRDRINEKLKELQELVPCCNKADKASLLDEAIRYLKSLQQQAQMMSMLCGVVPMMCSGMQQFIPNYGMGMSQSIFPLPPMLPSSSGPTPATSAHVRPMFPILPPMFQMQPVSVVDAPMIQSVNQNDNTNVLLSVPFQHHQFESRETGSSMPDGVGGTVVSRNDHKASDKEGCLSGN